MISKYNKTPFIEVEGDSYSGYTQICEKINADLNKISKETKILAIDLYPGVFVSEIEKYFIKSLSPELVIFSDDDIYFSKEKINEMIKYNLTDDRVFGIMSCHTLENFIDNEKLENTRKKIEQTKGLVIIYGVGASLIKKPDIYVYADLSRWEIQQRYRKKEICNWQDDNFEEDILKKYKKGFFFEWRIADRHKKENFYNLNYILDTNKKEQPKMIEASLYYSALKKATEEPFRVVPFFDPGVWGGQWMKDVCGLDKGVPQYAWCFDCVPEENSILVKVNDTIIETPSINIVFLYPVELLGNKVHARFGTEFPIRFDFLDTVNGGNLSLQVHPLTEYIKENFGMSYTQDESYYILDAIGDDAVVYLGLKNGINKTEFEKELINSQKTGENFDATKFLNIIPCKKHDHFLIPAGTVHCSGKNTMVLEISATPYIFTFKLWDWGRLGLDGVPRPIHLDHGLKSIQYDRDTDFTMKELVNNIQEIQNSDTCKEERTGLHEREFIETRRHTFSKSVLHKTNGSVNVLNLVEGATAIVQSPTNSFSPFIVNYAETFIIPANVNEYTITPYGESEGKTIITIKAYVRIS